MFELKKILSPLLAVCCCVSASAAAAVENMKYAKYNAMMDFLFGIFLEFQICSLPTAQHEIFVEGRGAFESWG